MNDDLMEALAGGGPLPQALHLPGGDSTPGKIEFIPQFGEMLSSAIGADARAMYQTKLPHQSFSFPHRSGGWMSIKCIPFGYTVHHGEEGPTYTQIETLANHFGALVADGAFGWGTLCDAVRIPLLPTKEAKHRSLLIVYAFSGMEADEIRARIDEKWPDRTPGSPTAIIEGERLTPFQEDDS